MKQIVIIYLIGIIVVFFLPVLWVKPFPKPKQEIIEKNNKVRLLQTETGEIITIDLEEYIMGVLIGEMPVTYELEALKAQAVVARTYTLNKMINSPNSHEGADMCDNIQHCQAYKTKDYALSCWDDNKENEKWNKIKMAVLETKNQVITYQGELINAFFHAHSGGKTEDSVNIWGRENIPYLKSVEGFENRELIEQVTMEISQLDKIVKEKILNYKKLVEENEERKVEAPVNLENIEKLKEQIKILEKNSSGRVEKMQISNLILEGTEVRNLFNLRSTFFDVTIENEKIIFQTNGYGHGVGLSQEGANSMALQGVNYKDIILHYYTGVKIEEKQV